LTVNFKSFVDAEVRVSRRFLISGRVQGVGFRYFAQRAATQHGLAGWVRNTPDGRVEIEAEGDADALRQFEDQITGGPPGARVDQVDAIDIAVGPRRSSFLIR
jgi:acylphosphatase